LANAHKPSFDIFITDIAEEGRWKEGQKRRGGGRRGSQAGVVARRQQQHKCSIHELPAPPLTALTPIAHTPRWLRFIGQAAAVAAAFDFDFGH